MCYILAQKARNVLSTHPVRTLPLHKLGDSPGRANLAIPPTFPALKGRGCNRFVQFTENKRSKHFTRKPVGLQNNPTCQTSFVLVPEQCSLASVTHPERLESFVRRRHGQCGSPFCIKHNCKISNPYPIIVFSNMTLYSMSSCLTSQKMIRQHVFFAHVCTDVLSKLTRKMQPVITVPQW